VSRGSSGIELPKTVLLRTSESLRRTVNNHTTSLKDKKGFPLDGGFDKKLPDRTATPFLHESGTIYGTIEGR
jgi:hypothetical protein